VESSTSHNPIAHHDQLTGIALLFFIHNIPLTSEILIIISGICLTPESCVRRRYYHVTAVFANQSKIGKPGIPFKKRVLINNSS
jgi:hypothetical protein